MAKIETRFEIGDYVRVFNQSLRKIDIGVVLGITISVTTAGNLITYIISFRDRVILPFDEATLIFYNPRV